MKSAEDKKVWKGKFSINNFRKAWEVKVSKIMHTEVNKNGSIKIKE